MTDDSHPLRSRPPGTRWLCWAVVLLASFYLAPRASAAEKPEIRVSVDENGSGTLVVNPGAWNWENCTPGLSHCVSLGPAQDISTLGVEPNTRFRVTRPGVEETAISPIWQGDVANIEHPAVSGTIRANELVTPVAGKWTGGWEGDYGATQLAACVNGNGTECTNFADPLESSAEHPCPNGAAILDPALTGDYLRVAERQVYPDPVGSAVWSAERGLPVWQESAATSVAVVGQIAPAEGPGIRTPSCGPPLNMSSFISMRGIATVHCTFGCQAVLSARSRRATVRLERRLKAMPHGASRNLTLSKRSVAHLQLPIAKLTLEINGKRTSQRVVDLAN
jgi:hypothetical protein